MTRQRALALLLFVSAACQRSEQEQKAAPAIDAGVVKFAPLAVAPSAVLPVTGFGNAVIVSPVGATRAMPLVVAVLGIGDTPESQCAVWREVIAQRAFVLCPRFTPHYVPVQQEGDNAGQGILGLLGLQGPNAPSADPNSGAVVQSGFRPTEVPDVEREIDAAVAATRKVFTKYIAAGPALYIGFSRGAFLGASLVAKTPAKYPRAILIEGGQSAWSDATATAYARGGGKRVLFACGQPSCLTESGEAAQLLARDHVTTRIVNGEGEGHGYKGPVKDQIRAAFSWVIDGDAGWKP
jgi:predicted esterase